LPEWLDAAATAGRAPLVAPGVGAGAAAGVGFAAGGAPADPAAVAPLPDAVLIAAMGTPHEYQVDGIGGGNPLSSVAIISKSTQPGGTSITTFRNLDRLSALASTQTKNHYRLSAPCARAESTDRQ
jgi:hypothetical protein